MNATVAEAPVQIGDDDLTIVVTAYNIEEYLSECLDSILRAGGDLHAILIIDDGSRDATPQIGRQYAERHSNIVYVHQENAGASVARNRAIDMTQTPFMMFIDGDDLLTEDSLGILKSACFSNTDIVLSNRRKFKEGQDYHKDTQYFKDLDNISLREAKDARRITAVHGKIFRKAFLVDNEIRFPEGMTYEDYVFGYEAFSRAEVISTRRAVTYLWRRRQGDNPSISQTPLTPYALESRLRQVKATIAISKSKRWRERFGRGPSAKREFGLRLWVHLRAIRKTTDVDKARYAFDFIRENFSPYRDWILQRVVGDKREAYRVLFDGTFEEFRRLRLKWI